MWPPWLAMILSSRASTPSQAARMTSGSSPRAAGLLELGHDVLNGAAGDVEGLGDVAERVSLLVEGADG